MNIEELASRHENDFPGYRLVDYYDAAFPVYETITKVLAQVQRPFPLVEEYILKSLDAGLSTIDDAAGFLGLERDIVRDALDRLQQRSLVIIYASGGASHKPVLQLTDKGKIAAQKLLYTEPEPTNLTVCIDALTNQIFQKMPLRQPKAVRNRYHVVPTHINPPTVDSLNRNFRNLKRIYTELDRNEREIGIERSIEKPKRELVELLEIEKSWVGYRIMRVLQFSHPEGHDLQIEVFDGIERSNMHEGVLLNMEDKGFRPLRAVSIEDVPTTPEDEIPETLRIRATAAREKLANVPMLRREIEEKSALVEEYNAVKLNSNVVIERQEASYLIDKLNQDVQAAEQRIAELEASSALTEALQMHEHRAKLLQAFRDATSHVIVISPWLTLESMDQELLQLISNALRRGVRVFIGHGLGDAKYKEIATLKHLEEIKTRVNGRFIIERFGDVHSKVLICDTDFIILTSFNWLSFKGDARRGSRVEDGLLSRDKAVIEQKTEEWLKRFSHHEAQILLKQLTHSREFA